MRQTDEELGRWIVAPLVILFIILLFRTAWLCDDAFITYRTIDHWIDGRGLVFNLGERVQAYSHPMWMLTIAFLYWVSGDIYFTPILASIFLSTLAVSLLAFRIAEDRTQAILCLLVLLSSQAFIDYSTSGLENPLTHLLLALFGAEFLRKAPSEWNLFGLALLGGLLATNRMDCLLLIGPALGYAIMRLSRANTLTWAACLRQTLLGFSPFLLWTAFSVVYYGFPFPNTAYAKLGTQIPRKELLEQGGYYFLDSLGTDPVTLMVIVWSLLLVFLSKDRNPRRIALGAGVVLYALYVAFIGGDFMSGRFLAAPLFVALMIFRPRLATVRMKLTERFLAASVIVFVGLSADNPPLLTGASYGLDQNSAEWVGPHGVANERAYYYQDTGLLRAHRGGNLRAVRDHAWKIRGSFRLQGNVFLAGGLGFLGFFSKPEDHLIDFHALVDPLLARLPVDQRWRIGHFSRGLPKGYVETLDSGENRIENAELALYYDKLSVLTRDPIFSIVRFKEIWAMNWRSYDKWLDRYDERFEQPVQ